MKYLENRTYISLGFFVDVEDIKTSHEIHNLHTVIIICKTEAYIHDLFDILYSLLEFTVPRGIKVYYVHSSLDKLSTVDKTFKSLLDTGGLNEICWPTAHIGPCVTEEHSNLDFSDFLLNVDEISSDSRLFLNCTHRDKFHRYIMNDMLKKHNLIDDGIITWGTLSALKIKDVDRTGIDQQQYYCKNWYPDLHQPDFFFEYILPDVRQDIQFNPYNNKDTHDGIPIQKRLKGKYFIEIITESETIYTRFTEKTFKAIFHQTPFIVLSCRNFHKKLVNLGFELYDEIFDYTFDDLPYTEMPTKAEMICKNLQTLKDQDYNKLQRIILPKLVRNKKRLFEILNNKEFFDKTLLNFLKTNTPSFYDTFIEKDTLENFLLSNFGKTFDIYQ